MRCCELRRNQAVGAGTRVTVEQWRDCSLHVRHERVELAFREIDRTALRPPQRRITPGANTGG